MSNLVSKVALGLSLTCALAMAEGAFVGFEGDYSFGSKLKVKSDDGTEKFKKGQLGLGVKAGYDFDIARVYGAYVYDFQAKKPAVDDEGNPFTVKWNTHKFIVGADYTPTVAQDFKLVLGGYTGYSRLKIKAVLPNETEKGSSKGWILGAKIGGEYSLDANNAIEFGFKADKTKYRKIDIKETNVGLYLGYNYKF